MKDLICRQAAIEAIRKLPNAGIRWFVSAEAVFDVLLKLPSAQPEIVRCKDCIYFDRYVDGIEKYQWDGFCADWARNTYEDWFCSRADMKGEQDE